MTKRALRLTKGISPILATLLLVVIAVAAIIVTYAWIMTYMGSLTQRAGEELVVELVTFNQGDKITIVLRSTGTSDSKIVATYIGTSQTNLSAATVSPQLPQLVASHSSNTFTITQSWTSGTRYYFKVITESGYAMLFNEQPQN